MNFETARERKEAALWNGRGLLDRKPGTHTEACARQEPPLFAQAAKASLRAVVAARKDGRVAATRARQLRTGPGAFHPGPDRSPRPTGASSIAVAAGRDRHPSSVPAGDGQAQQPSSIAAKRAPSRPAGTGAHSFGQAEGPFQSYPVLFRPPAAGFRLVPPFFGSVRPRWAGRNPVHGVESVHTGGRFLAGFEKDEGPRGGASLTAALARSTSAPATARAGAHFFGKAVPARCRDGQGNPQGTQGKEEA